MNNRVYNILFHTHTISGIIISAVLYVIFFAGSFSFFRDEIVNWERNHTVTVTDGMLLDLDMALDSLNADSSLYGRDIEFRKYYLERQIGVSMTASKDSLAPEGAKTASFFYLDTQDLSEHSYLESYSLGEFLYRLHFLAQIPYPIGYYLSGFVALFFLFAIITGILVHWKKIVSNFFVFRPMEKLKTVWTDAHTALGVLGLPFQFVYAVTGAFFMIKLVLVAPTVWVLYDNDQAKFYEELEYSHPQFHFANTPLETDTPINHYIDTAKKIWDDFLVTEVHIFNYGDENMHVSIGGHVSYNEQFNGIGEITYNVRSGEVVSKKDPYPHTSYLDGVKNVLYRIHYGDYGGYALKLISFLLGLVTCFVILSGVMIWSVARNKKNISVEKKRFNQWLVHLYLAICLSMYPVTALSFIAVKIFQPVDHTFIYSVYFIGWLSLSIFLAYKKNDRFTNSFCLLWGSILGFLIPIANGWLTDNWIWDTYERGDTQILMVDLLWIGISLMGTIAYLRLRKKNRIPS